MTEMKPHQVAQMFAKSAIQREKAFQDAPRVLEMAFEELCADMARMVGKPVSYIQDRYLERAVEKFKETEADGS